jgi:peptide/nickel transport system ATP-binding protein
MSELLEVRGLSVTYHAHGADVPAVRDVSFDLGGHESLGMAGESGSGKSTIVSAIMRLLPPGTRVEGEVMLDGEDVLAMSPGRLRAVRWADMAVVFQGALHTLNPVQRIGRQIAEAVELHEQRGSGRRSSSRASRARVAELLDQVGLPARRAEDYPHQLSGGQRQRVMIAMALACFPRLLIADEPTTALDVMVQAQVLELLARLRAELGLAMIFITHDLSLLASTCDRLVVVYAGRIVEEGPSGAVLDGPAHPYTRALAAAFPTIGDRASRLSPTGLAGDPPDPAMLPSGCSFHPRCPIARPECAGLAVELWPAGDGRRAACIEVAP